MQDFGIHQGYFARRTRISRSLFLWQYYIFCHIFDLCYMDSGVGMCPSVGLGIIIFFRHVSTTEKCLIFDMVVQTPCIDKKFHSSCNYIVFLKQNSIISVYMNMKTSLFPPFLLLQWICFFFPSSFYFSPHFCSSLLVTCCVQY